MVAGKPTGRETSAAALALMDRALALAERARGHVAPNPAVGCVVARDGVVVGEGWTAPPGGPHAEVVALEDAGAQARGATAFVTLEPCAHTGRTPPCTDALQAAGIARVVVAARDPNPLAGGGVERLRAAGLDVDVGVREAEARAQNAAFHHTVATGRPLVVAKLAVSLDGRIAARDGTSQWLTGAAARTQAHELRAGVDAVVVGSQTVVTDDPRLTVRLPTWERQPLRVVLDRRGRTSPRARVYDGAAPSLAVVAADAEAGALERAGVEVVRLPDASGVTDDAGDLRAALEVLVHRGVQSVLLEGGARVAGVALAAGLVDRLAVHHAPVVLGDEGRPALAGLAVGTLADAPRLRLAGASAVADDVVTSYRPADGAGTERTKASS